MKIKELQRIDGISGVLGGRIKHKVEELIEERRSFKEISVGDIDGVGEKKLFLIKYCLYLEQRQGQEILGAGYEEVLGGAYVLTKSRQGNIKLWFKKGEVEGLVYLPVKESMIVVDRDNGFRYWDVQLANRRMRGYRDSLVDRDCLYVSMFYLLVKKYHKEVI